MVIAMLQCFNCEGYVIALERLCSAAFLLSTPDVLLNAAAFKMLWLLSFRWLTAAAAAPVTVTGPCTHKNTIEPKRID